MQQEIFENQLNFNFVAELQPQASQTHKTGSGYLFEVLFKLSDEHPGTFYCGAPSRVMVRQLPSLSWLVRFISRSQLTIIGRR